MKTNRYTIVNANQAVADIAYRTNEVFPIYPITPASEMSELVEEWSAHHKKNIFDTVPTAFEMQSEAGVAGAMHGALQTGSLSSTFTASQGLLLMMPNMYKIAGELTPNVIHVATRSIATHALSVFGDHSDVMAVRNTGYALLASSSVQEAMDFALISQAASLASRVPFVHFFDGFRTSHEIAKVRTISDEVIKSMIDNDLVAEHRNRALNPNQPVLRGTSQGPDVFFQSRERINPYYNACPNMVQDTMDKFAKLTGRTYKIFEYVGHPEAEQLLIAMASATEIIQQTIEHLNATGEKIGLVKIRLYRPFHAEHFMNCIPTTCKSIAVLDRTKEPGATGEPLYLDVVQSIMQSKRFTTLPKVVGGRYGLSSKEFNPAMVKAVVENLQIENPKNNFTVGITDDITHLSLAKTEYGFQSDTKDFLFYQTKTEDTGEQFRKLLSQIGENQQDFVQGYTECDYRKSNSRSVAHLRVGKHPIKAPYLIQNADFVACDASDFLEKDSVLNRIKNHGVLIIKSDADSEVFWSQISFETQKRIQDKALKLYVANPIVFKNDFGLFQLGMWYYETLNGDSNIHSILMKGITRVNTSELSNEIAVELTDDNDFAETLLGKLLAGKGDEVGVGLLPEDGTYETNTSKYNVRTDTIAIPDWNTDLCVQCGACSIACPSGALRIKLFDNHVKEAAPKSFKAMSVLEPLTHLEQDKYGIQVNPEQCTSCNNCVDVCPAKALVMKSKASKNEIEKENWAYFESIPEVDRTKLDSTEVAEQQIQEPLFKYPMGEDGCGQAPYLKLLSQLYGDRMLVANATGASSIFGGALPTTPWSKNEQGRGPAWSNSLFEDNAEFGLGFRLSLNQQELQARQLLSRMSSKLDAALVNSILNANQESELEIQQQRYRIEAVKASLEPMECEDSKTLLNIIGSLVKKSVWIVGGDGWAYDIGYGGLDHVLASGENVNILVLDNEAYSNTGGQMSKATPYGASAKFAATGKRKQKKDLGLLAQNYEDVYVASVAMGANQEQTLKAFIEAEKHDGPSIIIAYCHSPSHGIDMKNPSKYHQALVASGQWLLYRNDPKREGFGMPSLQLDSEPPSIPVQNYLQMEERFSNLFEQDEETYWTLIEACQNHVDRRYRYYRSLSQQFSLEPIWN